MLVVLVVLAVLVVMVVMAVLVAASVAQQMVLIATFVGLSLMFFWVEVVVVRAWVVHHHRNWNIANIQTYLS